MKKYNLVNEALTQGQKITIVSTNSWGGLYVLQTVYHSCKPALHYQNCPEDMIGVTIIHKPKRKRTFYQSTIDYNSEVIIYDGWVDVNTDILYDIEHKDGAVIRRSKYTCFDVRNFEDIVKHYGAGLVTVMRA